MKNNSIIYEDAKSPFLIALYKVQGDIYGFHVYNNEVFRLNLVERKLYYCGRLPAFNPWEEKPFHNILRYQNLYFFVPFWNNANLYIYDCKKDLWKKIELIKLKEINLNQQEKEKKAGDFYGACVYQGQLFLLPFGCRYLIKYNIRTGEIFECADFGTTILKEDVALFHQFVWINTTCIALSCLYSNHVVLFNLETNETEIKTVGKDGYCFSTILKHEDSYWLVVKNKLAFLKWNPDTDNTEEFKGFPSRCMVANDRHCFDDSNLCIHKGYLYCFPASCNMAIKFDLKNGTAEEIKSLTKYCQDSKLNRDQSTFDGGIWEGTKVYLHYQLGKILEFDLETEAVQEYDRILKDVASIKKRQEDTLAVFWNAISQYQKSKDIINQNKQMVGKEIYDTISKLIL